MNGLRAKIRSNSNPGIPIWPIPALDHALNLDHQHSAGYQDAAAHKPCGAQFATWQTSVDHRSLPLGSAGIFCQFHSKNPRWQVNFSWFHWVNIWFWCVFPCFLGHQTSARWKKERSPDRLGRWGFASWAIWSWTFGTAEARCQHVIFWRCPWHRLHFFGCDFFWNSMSFLHFWRPRSVHGELFRISAWEHLPALRGRVGWCGWSHQIRHGFPGVSFCWLKPLPLWVVLN